MITNKTVFHWATFQRLIQAKPKCHKNRTYRNKGIVSNPTLVASSEDKLWVITAALDPFTRVTPSEQDRLASILNTYIVYRSLGLRDRRPILVAYLTNRTAQIEVASDTTVICNIGKALLRDVQAPNETSVEAIVEQHSKTPQPQESAALPCPFKHHSRHS